MKTFMGFTIPQDTTSALIESTALVIRQQDRIEELEAKLKIAVEALEYYTWDGCTTIDNAVEALTKIKGDV